MRLAKGRPSGSPNPPATSAGVSPRGSSISASGLPPASPRSGPSRARRAARDRRVQKQPGLVGRQPLDHELRQPLEHVRGVGLAQPEHQPRPARPTAGAPRTTASARTRGRANGRRRRCTRAAAPRRRRPAGSARASPTRKRSGGGAAAGRTPCSAPRAAGWAGPETVEHGRAERVQAGERQLHLGLDACRPGDPAARRGAPTGAVAGRSCRLPPRRGGPGHGSGPCAPPRGVAPAPRARRNGRPTPMMIGRCRPCSRSIIADPLSVRRRRA